MKVLIISPVFFPSLGGMEQHVMNLSKQLKTKKHSVDILTSKIGNSSDYEKINSVDVFRINAGINSQQELSFKGKKLVIPFFFKAAELFLKKKYDLIHVHDPFSLMAVIPLKLFRVPIVLTVHGNWINCIKGRRYFNEKICFDYELNKCTKCMKSDKTTVKLKQNILRWITEQCNAIIAVSSDVKNSIKLNKKQEIYVIPNVASDAPEADKKALNEFPFNSPKKKILFIGSMIKEKGAEILLKTAESVNALFFFVYSYSDKNYFSEFDKLIKKKNLKNVILFHKIPNQKVRNTFIPFSDIIVIPSLWPEPCSSIVTEAMSSKKAVIASDLGGFTDLIKDKENGLLFDAGNYLELKAKINELLTDKKLMKKISENGFVKTKNELNWNKISDRTIDVYREVLF